MNENEINQLIEVFDGKKLYEYSEITKDLELKELIENVYFRMTMPTSIFENIKKDNGTLVVLYNRKSREVRYKLRNVSDETINLYQETYSGRFHG